MGMFSKEKAEKKVRAVIVLEILGRPKEHIVEVMTQLVETIGKEPGVILINKKVHEAKVFERKDEKGQVIPMKDGEQELFSSFAEIEFEVPDTMALLAICFKYMPANVEIIEPEEFNLKNRDFNSIINEILRRLHHYDSVAKSALMHNQILATHLKAMQQNQQSKELSQNLETSANPSAEETAEKKEDSEKQAKPAKPKKAKKSKK